MVCLCLNSNAAFNASTTGGVICVRNPRETHRNKETKNQAGRNRKSDQFGESYGEQPQTCLSET